MLDGLLKLKESAKELLVLYVEDDEATRSIFENMLKKIFNRVEVAQNGKEGLEKFKLINPDIVVTDIQMPKMNGLEMSAEIKQIDKTKPIVLTTAFEDSKYFIKSIELGVDRYLLKPIKSEYMITVLSDIVEMIENNKIIELYKKRAVQEKVIEASFDMLKQTLESLVNIAIVYDKNRDVVFINSISEQFFNKQIVKDIKENRLSLDSFVKQKDGYLKSFLNTSEHGDNKIFLQFDKRFYIFVINKNKLVTEDETYELLLLTDITKIEYQKVKIENSRRLLKEFIIKTKYINHDEKPKQKPKEPQIEDSIKSLNFDTKKEMIDERQKEVLRKSHMIKLSAVEFCNSLDDYTIAQIDELHELDDELNDLIIQLDDEQNRDVLYEVSLKFEQYSRAIDIFLEFSDLSFAITSFAELIIQKYKTIDSSKLRKLTKLLDMVRLDLFDWRNTIFISKSTADIHYLDSSLFSSCLQIEMILSEEEKQITDDEDDLELF